MLNTVFVSILPLLLSLQMKSNFDTPPVNRTNSPYAGYNSIGSFFNNMLGNYISDYSYAHLNPGLTLSLFPNSPLIENDDDSDDTNDSFTSASDTWIA